MALTVVAGDGTAVQLGDFESGDDGWRLSLGREFPGAHGNAVRDDATAGAGQWALRLDGAFGEGGNYVAACCDLATPVEAQSLRFRARGINVSAVVVRIRDATGQCHQQSIELPDVDGWQTVEVRDLASRGGGGFWGGAQDGVWHGPAQAVAIILDGGRLRSPAVKRGVLWIDAVELIGKP
ncbi:MAG: hypothetical protein A3K19_31505 [Lentisphaerae bacterium RIFOXYB12_FULL_65_16]|nr:MAG: hypothetical protein A3K18_34390 [Lentisphaerae bacterium RIFOXYA12_64_32]OGV88571.1 MAG: hypothetical protein A3K19_31505 [Lentisphaerae bacterium RIFOXYB12_FULL_65_16]